MSSKQLIMEMRLANFHNVYGQEAMEVISKVDSQMIRENRSLAMLCNDDGFYRVYWGINDKNDILGLNAKLMNLSAGKPYISEIIFRNQEPDIIAYFVRAGLLEYSRLIFMTRMRAVLPPPEIWVYLLNVGIIWRYVVKKQSWMM